MLAKQKGGEDIFIAENAETPDFPFHGETYIVQFPPPTTILNHSSKLDFSAMAFCSFSKPSFQIKNACNQIEPRNRISNPRPHILLYSCHGREPVDISSNPEKKKDEKQGKQSLLWFLVDFEKLGKNLKENLSPKQKGDWKDLVLMSLSFAVYVYISQKIVCAYCAWTSMPNQTW